MAHLGWILATIGMAMLSVFFGLMATGFVLTEFTPNTLPGIDLLMPAFALLAGSAAALSGTIVASRLGLKALGF